MRYKLTAAVLVITLFISGITSGYVLKSLLNGEDGLQIVKVPEIKEVEVPILRGEPTGGESGYSSKTEGLKFFADELFASGRDENGKPFMIALILNRGEFLDKGFLHNYTASIYLDGKTKALQYFTFEGSNRSISTKSFINKAYIKTNYLTTDESYDIAFSYDNTNIEITVPRFNADFLVKNVPELTRYTSASTGTVKVNGKNYAANTALTRIYSWNKNKYVIPPVEIDRISFHMLLWDKAGNFYLFDSSDVHTPNPYYDTHRWVLTKDAASNRNLKLFDMDFVYGKTNGKVSNWTVKLPGLENKKFDLHIQAKTATNMGALTGTITTVNNSQEEVNGYYRFFGVN